MFAEEGWNFFAGEFSVFVCIAGFHHAIEELTGARSLTGPGLALAHAFASHGHDFFTIESTVFVAITTFQHGLESFGKF